MTTVRAPYLDAGLPIEARVADLLARMTLEEKIAQLGSAWSFELIGTGVLDPDRARNLLANGIGHISRVAGATNLDARGAARLGNEIQRFLLEETRLGIPALLHEETLHGVLARGAPTFQQSIGAAASWDAELVAEMACTLRRRMLAMGARHALAPVLDVSRDPRWGRIEETYGEDPYLSAALGCAYVSGLQGDDLATGVAATAKHLVGHGLAEGGLNQAPVHIGPRELHDEQLLPFEAAVRAADVASVMPAYCDVDGVPCHAWEDLLTTILRAGWGFEGVVASDYMAIQMLSTQHRLTADIGTAGAIALRAGVDAELPNTIGFGAPLLDQVATGRVAENLVDRAVERVLRLKMRLGLFEQPIVPLPDEAGLTALVGDERRVAGRLARRSLVLLENDGTLPLAAGIRRVAVVGPIAASARDLLGDYAHLLHIQTLNEMRHRDNAFGFPMTDEIEALDELAGQRTILDAIRSRLPGADVVHAAGSGIIDGTDADLEQAVAAASGADVVIAVLGERSGLTDDATTGEFRDRLELGFAGRQQELLERVAATGTPVVLVVVSGRPLALEWAARHVAAIVLAWVPGEAGPDAIADVLVGHQNPGGKLPVTVPRSVGQVPVSYRHHPSGGRSNPKGPYVDGPASPLWPFGFGRSYTTFELANLLLDRTEMATDGGEVALSVEVTNTGQCRGDEVVQLYVRDVEAAVARPVLELRGFRRISLDPGERRTVSFVLAAEQLAYAGLDYRRVIEPGLVTVLVGSSSADLPLSASLSLVGPVVELTERHRYLTSVTIA